MPLSRRGRLRWIAARNLTRGIVNRRATAAQTLGVLFVTAVCTGVASLGLAYGADRLDRLRSTPSTLCFWAESAVAGAAMSDADATAVAAAAAAAAGGPDRLRGCYAFDGVTYDWAFLRPDLRDSSAPLRGRTLPPGDPLLEGLEFLAGGGFAAPDADGVVVTTEMLKRLEDESSRAGSGDAGSGDAGPGDVDWPAELRVAGADGRMRRLRVVGVVSGELPSGHLYAVTPAQRGTLDDRSELRPTRSATSGPADGWPARPAELPDEVVAALEDAELRLLKVSDRDGRPAWLLRAGATPPPTLESWRETLRRIAAAMAAAGYPAAPEFPALREPRHEQEAAEEAASRSGGHAAIGVYVREPGQARSVHDAIVAAGYYSGGDAVARVDALDRATARAGLVLAAVSVAVIAYGVTNLLVTGFLRSELKVVEIGLLKAIGMTDGQLRRLMGLEAVAVWLAGTLVGLPLGAAAARLGFAWFLADGRSDPSLAFRAGPQLALAAATAAAALAFTLAAALVASRRARRASPHQTLRPS